MLSRSAVLLARNAHWAFRLVRNSLGERRPTEPLRTSYVALHGPAGGLRAARAASDVGSKSPFCAGCEVRRFERERDGLPGCHPERRPSPAGCHPERSAGRRGVEGSRAAPAKDAAVLNPSNLRSATRFGNRKTSAHPALAEIARYARFFRVTSTSSRRNRWSASAIRAQNRA